MPMAFDLASYNDVRTNAKTWDFVGRLGIEPRTQGFLDRGGGCLWIVPITWGFRDCKRWLFVVVFGCLDVFSDRKVSKHDPALAPFPCPGRCARCGDGCKGGACAIAWRRR
jgi:hypothetical protein